jgi:predicted acylesterase/phospholipase RssA
MIPPRHLVISGGGIKVVSIVGALKKLEEGGLLRGLKDVCGVSAGAWLAFMISMGLPVQTIEKLVIDLDFSVVRNFVPEAIIGFPETFGLDDGSNLFKFIESIMRVVINIDPNSTFESLRSNKIRFKCWATDLATKKMREFSLEKTPTVKIITALHASMAIPLYFTPVIDPITGHMLSDGGIQGSLPINELTDEEKESCLGIAFSKTTRVISNPNDLMEFADAVFSSTLQTHYENIMRRWNHKIISIPVDDFQSWNFEAGRDIKLLLLKKGYEATVKHLSSEHPSPIEISRRNSI